ncbi:hypothetical protein WR25_05194 [Diploscapter pachys]|uniref:Sulfotransferase domain-containing protein n=1 Tax=Diploscapter pachys TaxID=2018661 RepID=A0A2A2KZR8_9BILA|nr:hypothetical protein WR25_05194 [Diploscapter pachys]
MPLASPDKIVIEKSPAYFHNKDVPARIKQLNSKMKIILVVRDPVIRAISDYTQTLSKRKYKVLHPSFEKMALNWSNADANSTSIVNSHWGAIKVGIYHKHLKRWLQHFPPDQIHIVDGEKLITSPAAEVNQVEKFLGLKSVVKPEDFAIDPHKHFPCVRAKGELHCLGATKGRKHPKIQIEVLQKLADFFEPHNLEFFKMINRKFYWSPERKVSLIH